jgi:VCBS repeat-containing protein
VVKWIYASNNSALQFLQDGQQIVQFDTVVIVDGQGGSTSQVVTITINGSNDAAVITGPVTGTVIEADGVANGTPGVPTATGDLNSADVDNPSDAWTAVTSPTAGANGFGSYTLTAAGVWTYTLDNTNATVQALNADQTLTDTFTVTTVDGTSQVVSITINGSNDAILTGATTGLWSRPAASITAHRARPPRPAISIPLMSTPTPPCRCSAPVRR